MTRLTKFIVICFFDVQSSAIRSNRKLPTAAHAIVGVAGAVDVNDVVDNDADDVEDTVCGCRDDTNFQTIHGAVEEYAATRICHRNLFLFLNPWYAPV